MLFDPFVGGKKNFCIEITTVFPCYRKMALYAYSKDVDKVEVLTRYFALALT